MNRSAVNIALATEFLSARGIKSLFPAVANQLPCQPLNRKALHLGGYNPSILRHGTRTLLAYRWHPAANWRTELAMAELDAAGNVVRNRKIEASGFSVEDPRLFLFGGEPWISYTVSTVADAVARCSVRYGKLVEREKDWFVDGQHLLPYGKNDGTGAEKNWVLTESKGALWVIYETAPETICLRVEGNAVVEERRGPGPRWAWGTIRAGTPAAHPRGLVRFFHSRLNKQPPPVAWRYFVGAMICEPEPPFAVRAVSKRPILRGSEIDALPEDERLACRHWKASVVFPAGVVATPEGWLVSVGTNDSGCALVKVTEKDLQV